MHACWTKAEEEAIVSVRILTKDEGKVTVNVGHMVDVYCTKKRRNVRQCPRILGGMVSEILLTTLDESTLMACVRDNSSYSLSQNVSRR